MKAIGGEYGSILQAAARHLDTRAVHYFLDLGADIYMGGGKYGTALQASSYEHELDTMRLLMAHGAEANVIAGKYGNALQAAALKGPDLKAMQLLLDWRRR